MDTHASTKETTVEFYLPATFQFRHGPGRIERFLRRAFASRDEMGRSPTGSTGREFYLPGTPDVRRARSH